MLRYLSYAAPYILASPKRRPVRQLAGLFLAFFMIVMSGIFMMAGAFIFLMQTFGADIAFVALGVVLLISGLFMWSRTNKPKVPVKVVPTAENDPLAKFVPDAVKENDTVQKLLIQISESPVTATAAAVTVGMLLSKELFEEK